MSGLKILAHRGALLNGPENTLASFRLAFAHGADGIECDVRRTRDGQFVLFHDEDLSRVTESSGAVEARTWKELSGVRVLGREPIAHLDDILQLLTLHPGKPCFFDLSLTQPKDVADLALTVNAGGLAKSAYILTFSHRKHLLLHARQTCPAIGISVMPVIPIGLLETARAAGAGSICTGWNQWWIAKSWFKLIGALTDMRAEIERARDAGIDISGGVANTPEEVHWFLDRGFETIWTDDVLMARETLDAR